MGGGGSESGVGKIDEDASSGHRNSTIFRRHPFLLVVGCETVPICSIEDAMHDRLAAFILLFSSILFSSISLEAAEIRGKVVSVDRGEPLARVQVAVLVEAQHEAIATAITTKDGSFVIQGLAPGHYMLRLNAVGYRLITVEFSLATDEAAKEFDVT